VRFAPIGDLDFDGKLGTEDLIALVLALRDAAAYEVQYGAPALLAGDGDEDGDFDFDDISVLVTLLAGRP
jgi:hypothetical protein